MRANAPAANLTQQEVIAKTMADDGGVIPEYCTLPRPAARTRPDPAEHQHVAGWRATGGDHFYTLRPKPAPAMGGVGGRIKPTAAGGSSSFRKVPTAEDLAEESPNRSLLLYEQNMSTFENFCERRNSERQLQQQPHQAEQEEQDSGQLAPESLGNFCTLRKGRRTRSGADERREKGPFGGAYCTLKKKKLQLNRKFVESFLEDPNAKVVDYLSELDAYLDEMDGGVDEDDADDDDDEVATAMSDDSDSASAGSEDRHASETVLQLASEGQNGSKREAEQVGESLQYYQPSEVRRRAAGEASESGVSFGELYQEDRIKFGDIKHFCTLPKQKRTQFLNAFRRGASLRSEQLAELEEHQLTIAESDRAVATLEAKIALRRLKSGKSRIAPIPFAHFKAYCLDWVRKCETATEKVRFETRALERQNADRCALIEQKRQSVGSDALRVHLESFAIERLVGERELRAAQHTDYELRRLGAEVKREMVMEKLALFDATQRHGRLRGDVDQWTGKLEALKANIERVEREIESLEQQNEELTARLRQYRLPTVQDMANQAEELCQLQAELFGRVKKGILEGSIVVAAGRGKGGEQLGAGDAPIC
uniref:DUF4201 domain-containing protein n=1 Tax=Anopheles quadriannulatus TaxID=34691 RepID=A0A182XD66_ANOQN